MEASLNTPAMTLPVTPITAGRRRLGALLVADGLVNQHQIEAALARQQVDRRRLGDLLVREGLVTEEDLVEALAAQLRLKVADLDQVYFSPETLALLPRDFMINRRVLPLSLEEDGTLVLAMTDPLDIVALDEVRLRTKRNVRAAICTESAFEEASATFFNTRGKLRELDEEESLVVDETALAHDSSIIEIVDGLISDAVSMKASDIHVEPHAEALHVRCRIDGVLHKLREFPVEVQAGIVSRIKIMGNMDIAERRMPQDGRTSFETGDGKAVDLRLASIPTLHGENISIRILEVSPLLPTLDSLGFAGPSLERFQGAVGRPEGGVLICGPTGCGKSTTLYTTLELIKSPESKIYTVEDPIERRLEGVMQSEVRAAIGLDFAGILRTLLRSDPDIIMVGEIRTPRRRAWRPTRPSQGTWCSRPCTRATRRRPCTAWSRWACRRTWCPRPSRVSSRSASCAASARIAASRRPCGQAPGRSSASARRPGGSSRSTRPRAVRAASAPGTSGA